jgi:hypothetical protein
MIAFCGYFRLNREITNFLKFPFLQTKKIKFDDSSPKIRRLKCGLVAVWLSWSPLLGGRNNKLCNCELKNGKFWKLKISPIRGKKP